MSSSTVKPDAPPARSQAVLFARGVIARLAIWPALRIAVDQGWGGPGAAEKRTWLASVIVDAFEAESPPPDVFYVEETLLQMMADEYETELEDGSAEDVAKDVVRLWEEVSGGGKGEMVVAFEESADRLKGKKIQVEEEVGSEEGEEGEDDAMEDDEEWEDEAPQLLDQQDQNDGAPSMEPEVDEEGFTLVKSKRKGGR
jgi:pre-rRNA-processing protein TSR2